MGKAAIFRGYLGNLRRQAGQDDAREESFYSTLRAMPEEKASESGLENLHVTPLPRPTEGGNQVCHKRLVVRKDRRLQRDDIRTCCRMTTPKFIEGT